MQSTILKETKIEGLNFLLSEVSGFEKEEEKEKEDDDDKIVKSVVSGNSRGELAEGNSQLGLCIGR